MTVFAVLIGQAQDLPLQRISQILIKGEKLPMPPEKKGKTPRASKGTKTKNAPAPKIEEPPQCHIHEEVWDFLVLTIRERVCVNDEPLTEFEGENYCLFHLPTKKKDIAKFKEKFRARIKKVEDEIAAIEELSEEKQIKAKHNIGYEFIYVWFPVEVNFNHYKFDAAINFMWATFSDTASFQSATFSSDASFLSATFSSGAYFNIAKFLSDASFHSAKFSASSSFYSAKFLDVVSFKSATFTKTAEFNSTTFSAEAYFNKAKFTEKTNFESTTLTKEVDFNSAVFSDEISFRSATFSAIANFTRTKFSKSGTTSFHGANFEKDTLFDRARFRNNVSFHATVFSNDSDVFFRSAFFAKNADFQYCTAEGYVRFSNLRQGKENKFDFQEAAFEKAARVSFHTVRLFPNWFVNVDARKFVFTDIDWQNLKYERRNKNIWAELENLKERGIKEQSKRLLEITSRQLGVNAEENNRYEEAAKFRYMAMETRRLEELKEKSFSRYLIWLYKWTSGYGEDWSWAAFVLICLLFLFGVFYDSPFATFEAAVKSEVYKMNNLEGFVHSLYVAALQRPEPKAAGTLTKLFVILETIFAPVQAALLALAIRRKFMR
jgi:hypothetical protein